MRWLKRVGVFGEIDLPHRRRPPSTGFWWLTIICQTNDTVVVHPAKEDWLTARRLRPPSAGVWEYRPTEHHRGHRYQQQFGAEAASSWPPYVSQGNLFNKTRSGFKKVDIQPSHAKPTECDTNVTLGSYFRAVACPIPHLRDESMSWLCVIDWASETKASLCCTQAPTVISADRIYTRGAC